VHCGFTRHAPAKAEGVEAASAKAVYHQLARHVDPLAKKLVAGVDGAIILGVDHFGIPGVMLGEPSGTGDILIGTPRSALVALSIVVGHVCSRSALVACTAEEEQDVAFTRMRRDGRIEPKEL
jgi:hypothetical protein